MKPMKKKIYNHPATEIAEIEFLHVIMEGTVSSLGNGLTPATGEGEAPARYPEY